MTTTTKKALGRGLSALIRSGDSGQEGVREVDIDLLEPNRFQPRTDFDEAKLNELAQSIKTNGVLQPLLVRKVQDRYEIVAGERRWRAAQLAGLFRIPVVVRAIRDERLLEVALVENIQRENLNPIEAAKAFQRLHSELGLSHDEIAHQTGKDRTTVTNYIRLLKLPREVQHLIAEGKLSMGHARALLALESATEQKELAQKAVQGSWSVRQVERAASRRLAPKSTAPTRMAPVQDPNVAHAIEELERTLGTRVRIAPDGNKGLIEIEYYSQDDLIRLYELIVRPAQNPEG
ncbi:MAG: ParB/RepB/Spo0J family partition protein [Acidobacteriia bacterium]|nr:ParB/RepB/Spo0J family partition protein [Terriglobia bacterium]